MDIPGTIKILLPARVSLKAKPSLISQFSFYVDKNLQFVDFLCLDLIEWFIFQHNIKEEYWQDSTYINQWNNVAYWSQTFEFQIDQIIDKL